MAPVENETAADELVKSKTIWEAICRWLLRQGFNDVLLFAILATIAYMGWYAITTAIPSHLEIIQTGYDRLSDRLTAEHGRDREAFEKAIDRAETRCEAHRERGEKANAKGVEIAEKLP